MPAIEKNTDAKIKCRKCGNEYSIEIMRMDPGSKMLACRSCIERKVPSNLKEGPANTGEVMMKEYFCKSCKYNFKRAKHLNVKTCPYCGAGNITGKGSTARIMADAFKMKGAD